jgi:class 3 adenylate cyclase
MKQYYKYILILLLSVTGTSLYAQKDDPELIDSMVKEVQSMQRNSNAKASLLINIGMAYNYEKDYAKAKEYFAKASDVYRELGNKNDADHMWLMNEQMDLNISDSKARSDNQRYIYIIGVLAIVGLIAMVTVIIVVVKINKRREQTYVQLKEEKKKSEDLLYNVLPVKIAGELKHKGMTFAQQYDEVTVIFTDFVDFTSVAERFSPTQLVGELHACFKAFDEILDKYNMEKIKTVGDAYLAVSGLPTKNKSHAADTVSFALHIRDFMLRRQSQMGAATFQMKIGIHTGSVIAGIVGTRKFAYDIWGDTVNTAARMEQNGAPGKINISQATYELVKDKFHCEYRGEVPAKRKGMLQMYFAENKSGNS